jgi:Protein of unknown function (DUF3455)
MSRLLNIVAAMGLLVGERQAGTPRPEVPPSLQAPSGEEVVLAAHAKGVQIYVCQEGADQKLAWVLKGPEAELTDAAGRTIALHSAGPTWKHVDGSEVLGKVVAKENAPKPDAIPWLLLMATGHRGDGVFSRVTSIQRIHTEGGLSPEANTCDSSANGREVRSAYAADYFFYAPGSK